MKNAIFRISMKSFEDIMKRLRNSGKADLPVVKSEFNGFHLFTECPSSSAFVEFVPVKKWNPQERDIGIDLNNFSKITFLKWGKEEYRIEKIVAIGSSSGEELLKNAIAVLPFKPFEFPQELRRTYRTIPPYIFFLLKQLHLAIIGVSRTGFNILEELVKLRVRKITLIDPDIFELHHRDTLLIPQEFIGKPKVEYGRYLFKTFSPETEIKSFPSSVYEVPLEVLAEADVIFSAVDNLPARLYVDAITEAFNSLWIDAGLELTEGVKVGGEVRIFSPSTPRMRDVLEPKPRISDWETLSLHLFHPPCKPMASERPRLTFSPFHKLEASLACSALFTALMGKAGGRLKWEWEPSERTLTSIFWGEWQYKKASTLDIRGKGQQGIEEFIRWLEYTFELKYN